MSPTSTKHPPKVENHHLNKQNYKNYTDKELLNLHYGRLLISLFLIKNVESNVGVK